jgi:hypothetical protein
MLRDLATSFSGNAQAPFCLEGWGTYIRPDPSAPAAIDYDDEFVALNLNNPDHASIHALLNAALEDGTAVLEDDLYVIGLHSDFLRGDTVVIGHLRRLDAPPFEHDYPGDGAVQD